MVDKEGSLKEISDKLDAINETLKKAFVKKDPKKNEEEKRRIEKMKETIDKDRRTLLGLYHSQTQTHAGYLIALIFGFLTHLREK
jgi:hypothetical protein